MSSPREQAIKQWRAEQDRAFREPYPELARAKAVGRYRSDHEDLGIVRLGYDDAGRPVTLDTRTRLEQSKHAEIRRGDRRHPW
jgi:hypothetical protein